MISAQLREKDEARPAIQLSFSYSHLFIIDAALARSHGPLSSSANKVRT